MVRLWWEESFASPPGPLQLGPETLDAGLICLFGAPSTALSSRTRALAQLVFHLHTKGSADMAISPAEATRHDGKHKQKD